MKRKIIPYVCNDPKRSNIELFQKYCWNRLTGVDMLFSMISLFSGIILFIFSVISIYYYFCDMRLSTQLFQMLINSPAQISLLICVFCALIIIPQNHSHAANRKLFVFPPLGMALILCAMSTFKEFIQSDPTTIFTCFVIVCGLGYTLIYIGIKALRTVICEYALSMNELLSTYEYNSDSDHTGIAVVINTKRLADFSYAEALDPLLSSLSKLRKEPYRIYFCFTKNEVEKVITNPQVINLWIFGHGSRGGVDVADGPFYYDSLKDRDIPKTSSSIIVTAGLMNTTTLPWSISSWMKTIERDQPTQEHKTAA